MKSKVRYTMGSVATWIASFGFIGAIIIFFIINSAFAVLFIIFYAIFSIMRLIYRRQKMLKNKKFVK